MSWFAALRAAGARDVEASRPTADGRVLRRAEPRGGEPVPPRLPIVEPLPERLETEIVEAVARAAVTPAIEADDPVASLHARLEALEQGEPLTFHDGAAGALERFAERVAGRDGGSAVDDETLVERLLERAETAASSDRVRGGLLAALGALGATDTLREELPAGGEPLRSALVGLGWAGERATVASGLELDPARFLQEQPRGGIGVLRLGMSRVPDARTAGWLEDEILRPVDSLEALFSRELAVFALGTGVDTRPATRALFRRVLFDTHPSMQRLRPSVGFVLARTRGRPAREILVQWLADPLVGASGKTMVRWWMAEGHAMPGDVEALIAPLLDPTSDGHGRILAVGGLLRRLDRAEPAELQTIEDVLSLRVVSEEDETPRLATVTALALAPGGWQRMAALEHALRTDPKPACRGWAATGLGRTASPHTAEARAILRSVLPFEQDPSVRGAIQRALGPGG
ncbi:MAG: hypothetical protein ACYTCU_06000 [Planctomycetota bacterium]